MKQAHLDIVQSAIARAHRCFAEITAQHVRHRDLRERLLECAGDRVFYQTFAQTDAQIAGQKFDEILRFERRGVSQHLRQDVCLRILATS